MSVSISNTQIENHEPKPTASGRVFVALLFNLGIGLFLLDGLWQLLHGPFTTTFEHRINGALFYSGLGIAGVIWVVSSGAAAMAKGVLALAIVSGTIFAYFESVRRFDAGDLTLRMGVIKNGRVIFDGIGLSFEIPSGWRVELQPFVASSPSNEGAVSHPPRLFYGETAVFFRGRPSSPSGSDSASVMIQLEGSPFVFRSLSTSLSSVCHIEASYATKSDVRIISPTRFYQLGNLDIAEFVSIDDTSNLISRHVFTRSGEIRLYFLLVANDEKSAMGFSQFIRSIRIHGRQTRFN